VEELAVYQANTDEGISGVGEGFLNYFAKTFQTANFMNWNT